MGVFGVGPGEDQTTRRSSTWATPFSSSSSNAPEITVSAWAGAEKLTAASSMTLGGTERGVAPRSESPAARFVTVAIAPSGSLSIVTEGRRSKKRCADPSFTSVTSIASRPTPKRRGSVGRTRTRTTRAACSIGPRGERPARAPSM
jgi:hypothetical protein